MMETTTPRSAAYLLTGSDDEVVATARTAAAAQREAVTAVLERRGIARTALVWRDHDAGTAVVHGHRCEHVRTAPRGAQYAYVPVVMSHPADLATLPVASCVTAD